MHGSAKSQFDHVIIMKMKIEKGETFKQNEVFYDKTVIKTKNYPD